LLQADAAVLQCQLAKRDPKFVAAAHGALGKKDYHDVMSGVDHVIGLGLADDKRLGVMGWSYGGYLTASAIAQSRRFAAASIGAGMCNLVSAAGTSKTCGNVARHFLGGDHLDQPKLFLELSPVFHLKGASTPTLIQHGDADTVVPVQQAHELHQALQQQKCPVHMVVYPGMGHIPAFAAEFKEIMEGNLEWFDKHLNKKS
jgi:dipeptidyl aminopeptidase/acylaminoacyl peptidase